VTDPNPSRPKGATSYDIIGMGDEDFETMNALLIELEFPEAFKPAKTLDGGADMVLRTSDGTGYERCWQSKHYPGKIRWDECKASLASAQEHWKPERYTFIFPRELNVTEQKTFDRHFRGPNADIDVDHWTGARLQGRLIGSSGGQRIAKGIFEDIEFEREDFKRAVAAGGPLASTEDAVDRLLNVGGFLASKDAYFSYPAATHEADGPGPPVTPGSVMSFLRSDGDVASRVDVVPRGVDAMKRYGPEFVLQPTDDEAGEQAGARLQAALREGKAVEIGEGLDVTFTRMPPGFQDVVGQRLTGGVIQLGTPTRVRPQAQPWNARLRAVTDEGEASVDVQLRQVAAVPDGWDDAFSGDYGGMMATVHFRQVGTGGELRWNFRHRRNASPVREQLAALSFLKAASGTGELLISNAAQPGLPEMRTPATGEPISDDARTLLTFLEDVRAIEEWAEVEYVLPETITGQDAWGVAQVASIVRNQGRSVTWRHLQMTVRETAPLREGRLLRLEFPAVANLLGRVVELGYTRAHFADYVVTSEQPEEGKPGHYLVTIEPAGEGDVEMFEQLVKKPTSSVTKPVTKRPPSPPRKGKGGGKGRKKRSR
jgi:hypothetical protein